MREIKKVRLTFHQKPKPKMIGGPPQLWVQVWFFVEGEDPILIVDTEIDHQYIDILLGGMPLDTFN